MRRKLGQVIALSRLVLASIFLLAIYLDPSQPTAAPTGTFLVLGLYVAIALGLLVSTWRNWWFDHRLARPAHWLDLMVFAVVVFSTEGYTSPFFTFSLFLLLSAAIRWGDFEGAWNMVDPEYRKAHPMSNLEFDRYKQVQISGYHDLGAQVTQTNAIREIGIGVINRNTLVERQARYTERWRYDPEGKVWWLTVGLPDFWSGS